MATTDFHVEKLFDVSHMVAVVTGGGTGIGLMATQALVANGARVYVLSRREETLQRSADAHGGDEIRGEIIPVKCDVTKKESIVNAVSQISKKEKFINILVNNAGISGPKAAPTEETAQQMRDKLFESESFDEWTDVFRTNVAAVYFTTVAFLPLLEAGTKSAQAANDDHYACVINITSMSGSTKVSQGHFAYNAAKAAASALTKLMATEFHHLQIRVNAIAPGYFPSEMTAGESGDANKSQLSDQKALDENVPIGRVGKDGDIGSTVLFLARNNYLAGCEIYVDGGWLLVKP